MKSILEKLEKVEVDQISAQILKAAEGANKLINTPAIIEAFTAMKDSLSGFNDIMIQLNERVGPITDNVEIAVNEGQKALEKAQGTMDLIDNMLEPNAPLQFRFNELTRELAETARSIRTFVDLLERNPDSMIFGKKPSGEK